MVYARAYAPWDIYPEAMAIFDRHDIKPEYVEGGRKDNADLVMSLEIQEFLRIPGRDADTFILVTGDGDFIHVIRILQQEKKRVVVWGVEGSISNRLLVRVGELVYIQDLLKAYGVALGDNNGTAPAVQPPSPPRGAPSRDAAIRALIIRAETVMLQRGWVQVPFLTLLHEMSASTLFGADSEQRRMLIVRALEDSILETKKQPNPKRPGTDTTFILLKKENPTVSYTLRVVSRVVHHMRSLPPAVPGANWVPYDRLDAALAADPVIAEVDAGEAERRRWIDLCIAEGLLRMERKEDPANPGCPTPVLYLSEEHPLVQQYLPGEDLTPLVRRLIIFMDHYLTRTGYQWMSMGLLRRNLAAYGQREMERSIRIATESGILLVRQQPNQFGIRPTTGAYLQTDHPLVAETLAMRDRVLGALLNLYTGRDVAPARLVTGRLGEIEPEIGFSREEWIDLLIQHQILGQTTTVDGEKGFVLNRQHPVVIRRASLVS